uniref:AlNc14C244G9525 protein n=1 Tax=Albugo laibachii Nc14 TaxID=890382 RepID=F0WT40_9STRA|nr:AlNc14C244G9525 [Albugo laibachii Nc14]|eukprot:CCA24527.1 AlNc14C244G9525 [Albugo laibachii Nc14]
MEGTIIMQWVKMFEKYNLILVLVPFVITCRRSLQILPKYNMAMMSGDGTVMRLSNAAE